MSKQEEIKLKLDSLGISHKWLADKIGIKLQTLSFLLNDSDHFDDDLVETINDAIKTYQFELKLFTGNEEGNSPDLFDDTKLKGAIGQRIRIFAKRKYSTLKALAEAMEISPQQLQQYISGNREPGSRILIRFMKLGCDINWLLGGSESLESYKIYKLETEVRKLRTSLTQVHSISDPHIEKHHHK